jgi:uncharacterized protein (DUF1778 family)
MITTKKPMGKKFIFLATDTDFELLRLAAELKEISRSDFVRIALRKEAGKVLSGIGSADREKARQGSVS